MKKALAILLAGILLLSAIPLTASAGDIDTALLDEALGYVNQTRDVFRSGTFTIKADVRLAGPVIEDQTGPQVWVYDRDNGQKAVEFDKAFFTSPITNSNSVAFDILAFFGQVCCAIFRGLVQGILGAPLRAVITRSAKYLAVPSKGIYFNDEAKLWPFGFASDFNDVINCNVAEDDVVEVTPQTDGSITLLCADGRKFAFTDGQLSFYGHSWPSGAVKEWHVSSISAKAEQSYFDNEGMKEISLGWLQPFFQLIINLFVR